MLVTRNNPKIMTSNFIASISGGDDTIVGLFIGQSLTVGLFSSTASGSSGGIDAYKARIELLTGSTFTSINAAVGGTYAVEQSADGGTNFWMFNNGTPNTLATDAAAAGAGQGVTFIQDGQGEADSTRLGFYVDDADFRTRLKDAKLALYTYLRGELGNVPVIIQRNPARRDPTNGTAERGTQIFRDVYSELIAENSWIYDGAELYDLALFDNVHLDDPSYVELGERGAQIAAKSLNGVDTFGTGPVLTNVERQDVGGTTTRIWLEFTQEGSATWEGNPSSSQNIAPSQFTVFVDGNIVPQDTAVLFISSGNSRDQQVRLQYNTLLPTGVVIDVYNFYGNGSTVDQGNILHDSNGLPARTSHWQSDISGVWTKIN